MYTYYHDTLQLGTFMIYFSLFHIEIEVTVVELFRGGGGGATGMSPPPLKLLGGGSGPPATLILCLCYFHISCRRNDASLTIFIIQILYKQR